MVDGKKARGAPRRGPITDKTASIATKVRPDTLERLQTVAAAKSMSVSQAIEMLLVRGLDAEELFSSHFAPSWRSFESDVLTDLRRHRDDESALVDAVRKRIDLHAEELRCAATRVSVHFKRRAGEPVTKVETQSTEAKGSPSKAARYLDVGD